MSYRGAQSESRERYLATYDASEASKCDDWVNALTPSDHESCIRDIKRSFQFTDGMDVLDAGAGTGALCLTLVRIGGLQVTALEPCLAMSELLKLKPELAGITTVNGFCDHADDQSHFSANSFDVVVSRQLLNCLFDPLAAFRNWYYWLRPGGVVVAMDGLFDRADWQSPWDGIVDTLPLSACRTTATVPYLLEQIGFRIKCARLMEATNSLPNTRTLRYIVTATKNGG